MDERRKQLWIAMANLWLDTELTDASIHWIAEVVRDSGLDRDQLEVVFRDELAPFLAPNLLTPAGEWASFDSDWVCAQAQQLHEKRRLVDRLSSAVGRTTSTARPVWNRVLAIAFRDDEPASHHDSAINP